MHGIIVCLQALLLGSKTKITASASNYSIRIKKPSGLSASAVSCTDDYSNKRLRIIVNGNYKTFFSSASNRYIKESLTYNVSYSGGKTYIDLKTNVIKGFSVIQTSSYIYVKYADPKKMFYHVVVVDAGHGGSDSGAVAYGYKEKNMTLKIVQAAKKYFDKDPNIKVYYTRLSDTYPSLSDRSALANNVGADRFYSVHINSAGKSAHGTETLYNSKGYKSTSGLTSYKWSATIHPYIRSATGFTNRGLVDRTGLYVLRHSKTASTLTEIGFVSNKSESKKMNANLNKYGKAVYNSTKASLNKNPTKR